MTERDDRGLDEYLEGGSRLSKRYREASRESAPPELDAAILAQARAAVRPRRTRWLRPLALAATVVLGVNVGYELYRAEPVPGRVSARAEDAPAPAASATPAPPPAVVQAAAAERQAAKRESARRLEEREGSVRAEIGQREMLAAQDAAGAVTAATAPASPAPPELDARERTAREASEARGMLPPGWHLLGASHLYEAASDDSVAHTPPDSLALWRTGDGVELCGRLQTESPPQDFAGKDVRVSAVFRGQGVAAARVLLFASHGVNGQLQRFQSARVTPSESGWTAARLDLAIPAYADRVVYGALLCGPGMLWIDDVALDVR